MKGFTMSFYSTSALGTRLICARRDELAQADEIARTRSAIENADAVLIGAGAGLSTAAGFSYSGKRFDDNFADFKEAFGIADMYSGGFYPFPDLETQWAWWSRSILLNRYDAGVGKPYLDLLELARDKDYFVLTTNVDHQFQLAGFDKRRLFYTQGDFGLFQCSLPCSQETYDNEGIVREMVRTQKDMRIPTDLIPTCPRCGRPMMMNLRIDDRFVEDEGWHAACARYEQFAGAHANDRMLYLELGVGMNTPVIIKYPFWNAVAKNPQATYACVNLGEACAPEEIVERSILVDADIGEVLKALLP